MSSFYGNGISKEVMDKEIQETNNHIIFLQNRTYGTKGWRYLGCNWRICR